MNDMALHTRLLQAAQAVKASDPQAAVPSPCLSVCQMDEASGLCRGCLRTIDEIIRWGGADRSYQRRVWEAIEERTGLVNP